MDLFDLKYVKIIWDDELSGKLCFLGKSVVDLQIQVEDNSNTQVYVEPGTGFSPFKNVVDDDDASAYYKFCYYDPNYNAKIAYKNHCALEYYDGKNWNPLIKNIIPDWDRVKYRPVTKSVKDIFVTNKQLSEWLAKGNGEVLFNEKVTTHWDYNLEDELKPVQQGLMIRFFGTPIWCKVTSKSIGLSS